MSLEPNSPPQANRPWLLPAVIGLLALVASLSGIANQWAQDDIPVILKNPGAHELKGILRAFTEPYWPPPFHPSLYRPLASVTFIFQWMMGNGDPLVFRLVSYFVYALASVGVFAVARTSLPVGGAATVAALFAVHPLHVEAVAVAVNQSELWVGLLACLMVVCYVRERTRHGRLSTAHQLLQASLYLVACLFKENALIIPGLLVCAEVLLVRTGDSIRVRLASGRRLLLLLMLVGVAFYYVRTRVLGGNLAGTFVAEHLVGLTMGERAIAMLAVVPQWFRLLFWPAHLRADYGPAEFIAQTAWSGDHTLGLMLVTGSLVLAVATWRRAPLVTFGVAWSAIALFPVSNVLIPTGILLAERTLFLPSVGAMLALGAVAMTLAERAGPRVRLVLAGVFGAALLAGLFRSGTRHPVWHDQFGLWYQTANEDAPRSFRAHEALAEAYFQAGLQGMGEQEFQLAIQFAPVTMLRPRMSYADKLRRSGACYPAVEHYRTAVKVEPRHLPARAGLVTCLLDTGRYREAMLHARIGASFGRLASSFQQALRTADSALRVSAPPGTVRVTVPKSSISSWFVIDEKL